MTLKQIKNFLKECHNKGIDIPEGMSFIIDDFYTVVPKQYHNVKDLENNIKVSPERSVRTYIYKPLND